MELVPETTGRAGARPLPLNRTIMALVPRLCDRPVNGRAGMNERPAPPPLRSRSSRAIEPP